MPYAFDDARYIYLGDAWDAVYAPERCGVVVDAVLRGPDDGRVVRGRNRNQLVRFPDGSLEVVPGARLRLKEKYMSTDDT
jgi:hypothetical protein